MADRRGDVMKVACVGEAMIELAMTEPPAVGVAGDTLNAAIYLKRAAPGLEVSYVTRLGVDAFSDRIAGFIAAHDVGTAHITRSETRIPGLYAITTVDGERSFTYWRDQSAARELFQTGAAPDFSALEGFDVVYLSAITLAILPPQIRAALLDYLKAAPCRLVFDSNYRPRLWRDPSEARACIGAWWEAADVLLPSIDDEMALTGETAAEVAARFQAYGKTGALKRGAEGPLSLGAEAIAQHYAPAAQVIDTTAAGDSFNGAYLGAVLTGASQAEALRAGHDCAARVVGFRGAIAPV